MRKFAPQTEDLHLFFSEVNRVLHCYPLTFQDLIILQFIYNCTVRIGYKKPKKLELATRNRKSYYIRHLIKIN